MEQIKTKKCPFCAEEILSAAKVCKHCSRHIEEAEKPWYRRSIDLDGCVMGIIGIISFFAGFIFWPAWILFAAFLIYFAVKSSKK